MANLRIIGTGSYLPKKILTNFDLEKIVETSDDWITSRTGIKERRIAETNEASSDLAARALHAAVLDAGIDVNDLDVLIVATGTPDRLFPSTAVRTLKISGVTNNIPAFDLLAACSGFNYAVETARGFAALKNYRKIAVVGSEVLSKFVNWSDRTTCVLFGDGAGAVIFEASDEPGFIYGRLYSDPELDELLHIPGGGSILPPCEAEKDAYTINMNGREVFKHAVTRLSEAVLEALETTGIPPEDIDGVLAHQANKRIIDAVIERTALKPASVLMNIEKYGNTSAASIPLLLDEANKAGKLRNGKYYIFMSFGAGLVWGVHIYRHITKG